MGEYECFKNKSILITGGCGFIGSHLVRRMLEEGGQVHVAARRKTGNWRIKCVESKINIHILDITDFHRVDKLVRDVRPDYVFHLAAYGVDSKDRDYIRAAETNIMGTVNLFNAIKNYGCKRIINLGSCAEYGDRKEKMREDMCPCPSSIYGSTKACATIAGHQIARENHIDIATIRPFGIFGEGEERHKIFSYVITGLLKGETVELSRCEQERDYCYVENIIDGILMAAEREGVRDEIFNIGTGELHPLKYYIELIFEAVGTDKRPLYGAVAYRENEMWTPSPDLAKIKTRLGWKPRIELEEGIRRTVEWYRENLNLFE